jgi:hypothetical protein
MRKTLEKKGYLSTLRVKVVCWDIVIACINIIYLLSLLSLISFILYLTWNSIGFVWSWMFFGK